MSQHQAFRRVAAPPELAQRQETVTFPAPVRGIVISENETYMQPGAAIILDNWKPTMKSIAVRGGCSLWTTLPEGGPVYSGFEYESGNNKHMFFCTATTVYDTSSTTPAVIASGRTSGYHYAAQFANQGGDWMVVVDKNGDPPLRFNGSTWATLTHTTPIAWAVSTAYVPGDRRLDTADSTIWKCAVGHTSPGTGTFAAARAAAPLTWIADVATDGVPFITGTVGTAVEHGSNLIYVCKYRNRLFFIEKHSMNAWYLPLNAIGGALGLVPLSGATSRGGHLVFCAVWSLDAGDGIDDKLVFMTDLGEAIIFTGSNPADAANWRQEGRYEMSRPMGPDAHVNIGGDLLVATSEGLIPISACITKDKSELEIASVTRQIKPLWRDMVLVKSSFDWNMYKWNEYGALFTSWPGGNSSELVLLASNVATGAHTRFTGWDTISFASLSGAMYFGTQTGTVMKADDTGYDNGRAYTATMVSGWEVFKSPSQTVTWRQARGSFLAALRENFNAQLSATVDYTVTLPPPPAVGIAPVGFDDLWDSGVWDDAVWDAGVSQLPATRNTGWVSIGMTGYSHAAVVQITIGQSVKPDIELISVAGTFERLGVTV